MTKRAYTFGSNPTAADRLLVVARVFDPTMAAVLAELPIRRWRHLVDLGCGPGSSTERLLSHVDVERCTGVDASADFAALARTRVPEAAFLVGDVLAPLPVDRPDLVYARYLLSHLPDPLGVVAGWRAQLADDGYLVLEEPETIESDDAVVRDYLAVTAGVVASRGADMYVGRTLAALPGAVVNRAFVLDVAMEDAATMFALNLATVRTDPWVQANHDSHALDALAEALAARRSGAAVASGTAPATVRWTLRQVVAGPA